MDTYWAWEYGTGDKKNVIELVRADDAQRALDAEREKVKELEQELQDMTESKVRCWNQWTFAEQEVKEQGDQLATIQAQLRQVEGERDAHAQDVDDLIDCCINDVLVTHATPGGKPHDPDPQIRPLRDKIAGSLVELQTLRQLVEALPVAGLPVEHARSDDFVVLQANGEWMVHTYNYWAKFATEDEARAYIALLEYRASLPAQPAQGGA